MSRIGDGWLLIIATVVLTGLSFVLLTWPAGAQTPGDEPGTQVTSGGKPRGKAPGKATEPGKPPLVLEGTGTAGPPTKDEAAKAEAEAKAKAEAEKKAAEHQKQVEDLQKKLQEAEAARKVAEDAAAAARKAAEAKPPTTAPPAPTTRTPAPTRRTPAPKPRHQTVRGQRPAPAKVRVTISVKENKDLTIRNLRDQLAQEKSHNAILHAKNRGRVEGIELVRGFMPKTQPPVSITASPTIYGATANSYGSTATATANDKKAKARGTTTTSDSSNDEEPGKAKPNDPKKGAEGKAKKPDPKASNGAEGKGGKSPAEPNEPARGSDGKAQDEKKKTGVPIGLAAL